MKTIIVQMADREWTEKALHVACAMARYDESSIVLLRLIETQYSWLGTDFGYEPLSPDESNAVWDYKAIAEKYGIEFSVEPMQWVTFVGAVVDAVEALGAEAAFAVLPHSVLPLWHKFQTWDLRRQLQKRGCTLYTLEQPVQETVIPELETMRRRA